MTINEIAELTHQIAEVRRETVRPLLDQIGADLEREMRAAHLNFPTSVSIGSGTAILLISNPG
jgi:hypothetical protein